MSYLKRISSKRWVFDAAVKEYMEHNDNLLQTAIDKLVADPQHNSSKKAKLRIERLTNKKNDMNYSIDQAVVYSKVINYSIIIFVHVYHLTTIFNVYIY
jgi:hypothetical protein